MSSPSASRRNIRLAGPNRFTNRSTEETEIILDRIVAWWLAGPCREPRFQRELAVALGISQSYVAQVIRRFSEEPHTRDRIMAIPCTSIADLHRVRERRMRRRLYQD